MESFRLVLRVHAVRRMWQRGITRADVWHVLETGQVVQNYPDDVLYPSRLVLGWRDLRPIHVVVADDSSNHLTIVITAYEPDPSEWEPGYVRRKAR
ncbi:MAG TPA: DUF4258 domain-containing protein [Chloroflexota bacterium]|nr:DUF4258 domain-containing protein [Chloroflexota bacterium]